MPPSAGGVSPHFGTAATAELAPKARAVEPATTSATSHPTGRFTARPRRAAFDRRARARYTPPSRPCSGARPAGGRRSFSCTTARAANLRPRVASASRCAMSPPQCRYKTLDPGAGYISTRAASGRRCAVGRRPAWARAERIATGRGAGWTEPTPSWLLRAHRRQRVARRPASPAAVRWHAEQSPAWRAAPSTSLPASSRSSSSQSLRRVLSRSWTTSASRSRRLAR